jgi:hypothetical protein
MCIPPSGRRIKVCSQCIEINLLFLFLQTFLRRFVALDVQMIVKGPCRHASVKFYQQYLDHIWQQVPGYRSSSFCQMIVELKAPPPPSPQGVHTKERTSSVCVS